MTNRHVIIHSSVSISRHIPRYEGPPVRNIGRKYSKHFLIDNKI